MYIEKERTVLLVFGFVVFLLSPILIPFLVGYISYKIHFHESEGEQNEFGGV